MDITSTKSTNKGSICRLKKKCTFKWDANNPLKKDRQSLMMSKDNPALLEKVNQWLDSQDKEVLKRKWKIRG